MSRRAYSRSGGGSVRPSRSSARSSSRGLAPTGTTETVCTVGWSAVKSRRERSSASPSFTPGVSTICVCARSPSAPSRSSWASTSGARGLPSSLRRRAASVACTDTFRGLSRCSSSRAQSSSVRFVSVTKLPCRKLSR